MEPRVTPANTILIVINIGVFLILSLIGNTESAEFLYQCGAMEWQTILEGGEYYRIFTSMFLHFGFEHIFQNMIFLFLIGCYLEDALGSVRYFIFYLLAGIGAGFCSLGADALLQANVVSAGASGAIFGVVGGLLSVVLRNKGRFEGIGLGGMVIMIIGSLYYGFTSSGVDNVAHVGGFVWGLLLGFLFYRKSRKN
ncbi:MAG: rhomboid family intramembrane serine protease [Lachnospiraceae bacterium]|nr:rhomboid family intramembrane serine protease [Lachnospiraceae bacterium]